MFPEFQLLLLFVRGRKGGQKTSMKIQIRPILMKFKPSLANWSNWFYTYFLNVSEHLFGCFSCLSVCLYRLCACVGAQKRCE